MQRNAVEGMVGSGGSFHAYDPESVAPGRYAATAQKRRRCHSCTKLRGKMTLQKNSSDARTRKRKFQEQSENHSSSTATNNRQTCKAKHVLYFDVCCCCFKLFLKEKFEAATAANI